jgi:hypothetical protein
MAPLLLSLVSSALAATTLNIPVSAFVHDADRYSCNRDSGDRLQVDGGDCYATAPLLLPSGTVVSGVKVYYYDNSSGCSLKWYFMKHTTSASGGSIDNGSSTSSSTSVRSDTLTGGTLSSSYFYSIKVEMTYTSSNSCYINGVQVTY